MPEAQRPRPRLPERVRVVKRQGLSCVLLLKCRFAVLFLPFRQGFIPRWLYFIVDILRELCYFIYMYVFYFSLFYLFSSFACWRGYHDKGGSWSGTWASFFITGNRGKECYCYYYCYSCYCLLCCCSSVFLWFITEFLLSSSLSIWLYSSTSAYSAHGCEIDLQYP